MKRFLAIAISCAALSSSAFCADQTAEFKKFMLKMLPKLEAAFKKMDASFFDKISTDDFTETMMGHTLTKEQSMAQMKQQMKTIQSCSAKFKLLTAKAANNTGITTTAGKFKMVTKPGPDKKTHTMEMQMTEKETWVKVGKEWKIKKLEEVGHGKMTMDGKPFDPSKMGGGGGG